MKSAKRVNIVSIKLVKESSILYKERKIRSPKDSFELLHKLLENKDREHFIVVALCTKMSLFQLTFVILEV